MDQPEETEVVVVAEPVVTSEDIVAVAASEVLASTLAPAERQRIDDLIVDSVSENTKKAYRTDWRDFEAWCLSRKVIPLPADPHTVAAYLDELATRGLKWSTLDRRTATISQAHRAAGLESPTASFVVAKTRQALRNRLGIHQRRADPLTVNNLKEWIPLLPGGPRSVRDAALIMLGFSGAMRRSEVAGLHVGDVEEVSVVEPGRLPRPGLLVRLRKTKTAQAGELDEIAIVGGQFTVTCPVTRWRQWLGYRERWLGRPAPDDPLFVRVKNNEQCGQWITPDPIGGATVCRAVKRLARVGSADPGGYSGHSLRAGLITEAVRLGAPYDTVMVQSRHRSHAVFMRYVRRATRWEGNPSGLIGL